MLQIDIGDGSSSGADIVPVTVSAGQTVNISNLAAGVALNYFLNGIDGAATSLAAGANVNVTAPTWLQVVGGVTTVQITGGQYG